MFTTFYRGHRDDDFELGAGHVFEVSLDLAGSAAPLPSHFLSHLFAECRPILAAP